MGFEVGYAAAALAGLLSFLSPCILPIVPFYLCYLAGVSFSALGEEGVDPSVRSRLVASALLFALGVATIFIGLGATASIFGQQLREWFDVLRYVAAALIFVLALHFLGVLRIGLLYRQARFDLGSHRLGLAGAFFVGMAFAFGWTPCVGPVLAAILFTASASETAWDGAGLLLSYAVGMTAPFVGAALFAPAFLEWAKGFRRHLPVVERVMGVMLIGFSGLIATNSVSVIADWMIRYGPDIGVIQ